MKRVSGFVKGHRLLVAALLVVLVVAAIGIFNGEDIASAAAPYALKYLNINLAEASGGAESAKWKPSISVDAGALSGKTDAEQAAILASLAKTTQDQAKTAALAGNAGTTVTLAKLEVVNGGVVYSVALSNGSEVLVDAGSGAVLQTTTEASKD